jgi:cysteine desulfurase/selenocysteine lyase
MRTAGNLALSAPPRACGVEEARADFPALRQTVHGQPLVYLDNAATAQKPQAVIDALCRWYARDCANVHRGLHTLSERSTAAYEGARRTVQRFLNAREAREIVFVRGATEGINLAAQAWGREHVAGGDEILISGLEHHSNIVPWQMLAEQTGARLRVAPINERGEVILEEYERLLGPRTRMVAVAHVSNALGTINPVREMIRMARRWDGCSPLRPGRVSAGSH